MSVWPRARCTFTPAGTIIIGSSPAQQHAVEGSGSLPPGANTRRPSGKSIAVIPSGTGSRSRSQIAQNKRRRIGSGLTSRLFTSNWRQLCFRISAISEVGTPTEQCARGSLRARATAETLFPGWSHSSTMTSFSSSVKLRRWARPSRPESVTGSFVKLFSTSDSLAALLALQIEFSLSR